MKGMNYQNGYQDLIIWQVGMEIVERMYQITNTFPVHEKFGLSSQMRRAAVSLPSNISEGYHRKTSADFLNFLHISYGSAAELETQLIISLRLNYISKKTYEELHPMLNRFLRLMNGFIQSKST